MGKTIRCNGCDKALTDYRGAMMPGEAICDSIVYGAKDIVLCKRCCDFEHDEEERLGTNNIPHLLSLYNTRKDY